MVLIDKIENKLIKSDIFHRKSIENNIIDKKNIER